MSKKESYNIFHAISWNIFSIFVCHVDNIKLCGEIFCHVTKYSMTWQNILPCHKIFYDMEKYSLTSHGIFCHITSMVCYKLNNGLLTLNMGLAKKVVERTNVFGQ